LKSKRWQNIIQIVLQRELNYQRVKLREELIFSICQHLSSSISAIVKKATKASHSTLKYKKFIEKTTTKQKVIIFNILIIYKNIYIYKEMQN
jgi:hypothetical protein